MPVEKAGPAAVLPTAPAYSFGSPATLPLTGDTGPGPGAYFTQEVVKRPGGYSVLSTGGSAPAATIRVRPLDARLGGATTPGPGEYEPRDALLRRSSPQFTFKGVDPKDSRSKYPSVGHYNPERADKLQHPAAPSVSIAFKHPPPESYEKRPAPGEYGRAPEYRVKCPLPVTLKFRRPPPLAERPESGHAVPGPGEYKLPSTLGGPRHTIATRLQAGARERKPSDAPGPGFYEIYTSTIGLAGRLAKRP